LNLLLFISKIKVQRRASQRITTNEDLINYDFYNSNNIFVLKKNTNTIPESFNTRYLELPEGITKNITRKAG